MKNKEDRTMKNKTKMTYRQVGNYKIPNIILPPEQANITVGKWACCIKITLNITRVVCLC